MELAERLARVRLLLLDVDGVLTDGTLHYDADGGETKSFDVTDGQGLKLLQRAEVEVGLVTSRSSQIVSRRAAELGIEEVHQGARDKLTVVREILTRKHVSSHEVAYVGDDLMDLPVLMQVGAAISVADAREEVRRQAHWVTERPGGRGAVREVCEAILKAKGHWEEVTHRYFHPEPL